MNWYKKAMQRSEEDRDIAKIPKSCKGGDCYCASGRYVMSHGFSNPNLKLVHGEVTGQGKIQGIKYGHAWIEDGEEVIDVSGGRFLKLPKVIYYAIGRIEEDKVFKYDVRQVIDKTSETGNWGPWDLQTKY